MKSSRTGKPVSAVGGNGTRRVAQVMRLDPPCCTPEDSIGTAKRLMSALSCDCLPVVEPKHNGRLVGIVTASELDVTEARAAKVSEVMSVAPISCSISDDVESVDALMSEKQVPAVPVVDEWGCCIGMVTRRQLRLAASAATRQVAAASDGHEEPPLVL